MKTSKLLKITFCIVFGVLFMSACAIGQPLEEDARLADISPSPSQEAAAAAFTPSPQVTTTSKGALITELELKVEPVVPDNLFVINRETAAALEKLADVLPYFPGYYLISDNGRVGAYGNMSEIAILDMETGEILSRIPTDLRDCSFGMDRYFRFNQDGSFIAMAARNVIQVWQVGGGLIYEATYNNHGGTDIDACGAEMPQLALSPDGTLLAVSGVESNKQYFRVVDLLANSVVYEWNGSSDSLHGSLYNYSGLGFSQDGKLLQSFDPTRFFAFSDTVHEAFRFWSLDDWQEVDRNSAEIRDAFSETELLFALQNNSDTLLISDRINGQELSRLTGTGCSLENPCDIKLSPRGSFAAVLDYSAEPVLYNGDVLATNLEVWNLAEQSLINHSRVLLRNLDAVTVTDEGEYRLLAEQVVMMPPDNSWWTSAFNFSGLTFGPDGQIMFSPQQVITSSDTSSYYPGTCILDLYNLEINCDEQFYSVEGRAFTLVVEDGLEVLKSTQIGSLESKIELELPADYGEGWSLRVLGISEEYQTVFYCLDKNKRNQNCLIYDYADGVIIDEIEDMYSLRFSPEGDYAVYINREEKALYLVDLASAKVSKVAAYQSRAWLVNPAFASEGTELVYMIQNLSAPEVLSLEWVDAEGANVLRRSNLDSEQILDVSVQSWSRTGELIALGSDTGMIYLLEQAKGKLIQSWQAHADGLIGLSFSTDGKLLVSMGMDGRIRVWGVEK